MVMRFSFRAVLMGVFAVQVVGIASVVSYLHGQHEAAAHQSFVRQLVKADSDRIQVYLSQYLQVPQQINRLNATAVRLNQLDVSNLPQLEAHLFAQLQQFDSVSSILFSGADGSFRTVHRSIDDRRRIEGGRSQPNGDFDIYLLNEAGAPTTEVTSLPNFDGRDRPWYRNAERTQQAGWSDLFQIGEEASLAINAYQPIYNNNTLLGVFSVNLSLLDLSRFLRQLDGAEQGVVFIVDENGYLIASSTDDLPFQVKGTGVERRFYRLRPADSDHELLAAIATHWPQVTHFSSLGIGDRQWVDRIGTTSYVFGIHHLDPSLKLNWQVVNVLPESVFLTDIRDRQRQTFIYTGLALLGAIALSAGIARWATQPLKQLRDTATRLADGDFHAVPPHSPILEFQWLSEAFETMSSQLRQSFQDLQLLNQTLQHNEAKLSQFLELAPVGVLIYSLDGSISYVNAISKTLFGLEKNQDYLSFNLGELSQHYSLYIAGTRQSYPLHNLLNPQTFSEESVVLDDLEIHQEHHLHLLEVSVSPMIGRQGDIEWAIAIFNDITTRKQAEQLLEHYNRELAHQVQQQTLELAKEVEERRAVEVSLRQSEQQQQILLQAIPDLMFRVSRDGVYLGYVKTNAMIDLLPADENPIGKNITDFFAQHHHDIVERQMHFIQEALDKQEIQIYEQQNYIGDRLQYEEVRVVPCGDQEVLFMIRDISDRKKAESALRYSEATQRAILQAIPDLLLRIDKHGQRKNFISGGEVHLRQGVRYDLEQSIFETLPHDLAETRMRYIHQALETGQRQHYEHDIEVDHEIRHEEVRIVPLNADEVMLMVRDITDRTRAEVALRQSLQKEEAIAYILEKVHQSLDLKDVFSSTVDAVQHTLHCDRVLIYRFQADWSGEILAEAVTPQWTSLLNTTGYDARLTQNAIAHPDCIITALTQCGLPHHDTYLQDMKSGFYNQRLSPVRAVSDIYAENFSDCYLDFLEHFQARAYVTCPIIQGDQIWGLLAVYHNQGPHSWTAAELAIVGQTATQLGIAAQQAELFLQLQLKSTELEIAREAAEAASKSKSVFLANMSHELRTPLNAILGFAQLLDRDLTLPDEHREAIHTITRSGEHLLSLINGVLDLSKIEAGHLTLERSYFDFREFIRSLQSILVQQARSKGLSLNFDLSTDLPRLIKSDPQKLRQVLINLLGNAIKFTSRGGVTLKASIASLASPQPQSSDRLIQDGAEPFAWLTFEVIDTGTGIAPDEQVRIFEAFEQTHSGQMAPDGTGLGLTISQRLVEKMGGCLTVQSVLGQGSAFQFTIPVGIGQTNAIEATQGQVAHLAPHQVYRILVVDDSMMNRQVIVQFLTSIGFEIREAADGAEAIAQWQDWNPHLILLDLRMPVLNGLEVIRHIRAYDREHPPTGDRLSPKVIAVTASALVDQQQEAMASGCDDFITKPVDLSYLLEAIAQHINVDYMYDDLTIDTSTSGVPCLEPDALSVMPQEWLDSLYLSVLRCEDAQVDHLIQQIPSQYNDLKQALDYYNQRLQLEQILLMIEAYQAHGSSSI
ncbi:MAG: response regulator [Leptolyngbya sp. DLM2.Bin15]|nr:MAG: response regulator [Leptolyngbya sp. DLM2.Bin15]